jgi:micrococcal nuclease
VIIVLGIGAFCLVCVAASLFVSIYSSLFANPTVLVENISTTEISVIPFQKATTETIIQVTNTATIPSSPTATFTSIPSLTMAPTSDVSIPAAAPCVVDHNPQRGIVTKVVNADTIDVAIDNQTFPVRYIGMDTPEMGDPMGLQAKTQNATYVEEKSVTLYRDKSETDKYNRLLRYVFVGDLFVNYEMVKTEYAEAKSYDPDTACDNYFTQAQNEAMAASLGLWAAIPPTDVHVSSTIPLETSSNCDPAHPTICIPSPPPDLDCPQIPYTNFKVLPPDPHHFDGDGDGIGCEEP